MNAAVKQLLPKSIRDDLRSLLLLFKRLINKIYKDVFFAPQLKKLESKERPLKINFGSGKLTFPGWVNIDFNKCENNYYYDLRDRLPLPDQCASHIHCEHFLEHLTQEDANEFLKECHRLLQQGGVLRLILPDAEKYMRAYVKHDKEFFSTMSHHGNTVEPLKTSMEVINQMFRMGGDHFYAWDFETLAFYLKAAGFSRVEKSAFRKTSCAECIDGDDKWRIHESLYLNAFKN